MSVLTRALWLSAKALHRIAAFNSTTSACNMETVGTQGVSIPRLGFGTFRMPGGGVQPVVESAIEVGFRHFDTAAMYDNEEGVGSALRQSGQPRADFFVTTKVWHDMLQPSRIRTAFDASLRKLGLDYVDMYMVHWPTPDMDMTGIMKALQSLRDEGLARSIGVCNFNMPMLRHAVEDLGAPLAAVQVEYHPFLDQSAMLSYARSKGIALTAHAPLAQGRAASDPLLARIGSKHGVSAAQVAIAWLLSHEGVVAIPKAGRRESQVANLAACDIRLDAVDLAEIASLPKNLRYVRPPFAPDWDATTL